MRRNQSAQAALLVGLFALVLGGGQALGQERQRLIGMCTDAAQRYFGDYEARTNIRWSEPRVDGTRTVGGDIYLETRKAYVMCAFPPRGRGNRLTEFFVDGQDRLAALRRPGSGAASGRRIVAVRSVPAGDTLNLRAGPGTSYRIVGVLSNGTRVRLLDCEGAGRSRWCQVEKTQFEMRARGWVEARYLALDAAGHLPSPPTIGDGRWTEIGRSRVSLDVETDRISVRGDGRFRAIRICVRRRAVEFRTVDVVFGNGQRQDVRIRRLIPAGDCTRTIDLQGGARRIRNVTFRYQTARERGRQAVVVVSGLPGSVRPPVGGNGATGRLPCTVRSVARQCNFRLVRRSNGDATLSITLQDRGVRRIEFRAGRPVSSNGPGDVFGEWSGDNIIITIGPSERFIVPNAVVFGG